MKRLQESDGANEITPSSVLPPLSYLDWEDVDDDAEDNEDLDVDKDLRTPTNVPNPTTPSPPPTAGPATIESKGLPLPSYNAAEPRYREAEIKARITQANRHLSALRELIVTKAFQYSSVLRRAPRKSVRTRSRKAVYDISQRIMYHTQVYNECRLRLQHLHPNAEILKQYQELTRDDIHSSTVVIDPNSAGSTRIQLSWIWHGMTRRLDPFIQSPSARNEDSTTTANGNSQLGTSTEHEGGQDAEESSNVSRPGNADADTEETIGANEYSPAMLECEHPQSQTSILPNMFIDRRVHWLRARAQSS